MLQTPPRLSQIDEAMLAEQVQACFRLSSGLHHLRGRRGAADRCAARPRLMAYGRARQVNLVALAFVFLGCSAPAVSAVTVSLSDFKIETSQTVYQAGTKYRFELNNDGATAYEWSITPAGGADHMRALKAVEEDKLTPGRSVTIDYTFTERGNFEFACHLPGHYEAGMKAAIRVE